MVLKLECASKSSGNFPDSQSSWFRGSGWYSITGTTSGMAFSNRIYSSLRRQKPDIKGLQCWRAPEKLLHAPPPATGLCWHLWCSVSWWCTHPLCLQVHMAFILSAFLCLNVPFLSGHQPCWIHPIHWSSRMTSLNQLYLLWPYFQRRSHPGT